mmetsp:Transcript_5248/g.16974  ORF Transcript_5248/g.16974 Transcript_5248/m.16974 type:complete len:252 (-) Transcript_5248:368-1123(-)
MRWTQPAFNVRNVRRMEQLHLQMQCGHRHVQSVSLSSPNRLHLLPRQNACKWTCIKGYFNTSTSNLSDCMSCSALMALLGVSRPEHTWWVDGMSTCYWLPDAGNCTFSNGTACCTRALPPGMLGTRLRLPSPRALVSLAVWSDAPGAPLIRDPAVQMASMSVMVGNSELSSCRIRAQNATGAEPPAPAAGPFLRFGLDCGAPPSNFTRLVLHMPAVDQVTPPPPRMVLLWCSQVAGSRGAAAPPSLLLQGD